MTCTTALIHNLGTFEGFNFRTQSAIERPLSAQEVIGWDHDAKGEAEFWPAGDYCGIRLLFRDRSAVTASELRHLDQLLTDLGYDSPSTFVRIRHAIDTTGMSLAELTLEMIEGQVVSFFEGTNFTDLRRDAAFELFEAYYPDLYRLWESTPCDGLVFDTDRFLDSPSWSVAEYTLDSRCFLAVAPA